MNDFQRFFSIFFLLFSLSFSAYAVEMAPRINDREIIESLAELKAGQKSLEESQKMILREMDKRFEAMDKRFESIDKRFEEQGNLLVGMMATFGGMVAVMIALVVWDRRTTLRPFETKVRQIENQLEPLEPLAREARQDRQRFQSLLDAVRVLAQNNPQATEILKAASLL